MFPLSVPDFLLTMATGLMLIGIICLVTGIFLLVSRAGGKDIAILADETTKLAQKGIAEDVAGLVGNAGALMNALTDMVRTTAGIGIFLMLVGLIMLASTYLLIRQIPLIW